MISAEAPILFAKGCDIFITELTMRAWIHAEENKRRTLQRSDIASALAKSDMFDFLIDIVPREEAASHPKRTATQNPASQGVPPSGAQLPAPQNLPPQATHPPQQHAMAPPDYSLGHGLPQEQDYRPPPMYTGQVQAAPPAPYPQPGPHMYGEMDGMYGYPPMQAPQVGTPFTTWTSANLQPRQMYHVPQRTQDASVNQDPSHSYARHDGGEGDADAEGERDYEVG
jgi:nuclear transcription factor Y gamma